MVLIEERWHIYNPENKKLEEIDFNGIPKNPGYIFLECAKKRNEHYHAELLMFSPSGEAVQKRFFIGYSDIEKLNRECDAEIKNLSKLAHELSMQFD